MRLDRAALPAVQDVASQAWAGKMDPDQIEGLNRILNAYAQGLRSFALGDGTGVGKTRQQVAAAVEAKRRTGRPAVVITPAPTVQSFVNEMNAMGVPAGDRPKVFTYDDLRTDKVPKQRYSMLVFDEGHSLKNKTSARSKAAAELTGDMTLFASATAFDTPAASAHVFSVLTGMNVQAVANRLGFNIAFKENGEPKVTMQQGVSSHEVFRRMAQWRDQLTQDGAMLRRVYPFFGQINKQVDVSVPGFAQREAQLHNYWQSEIDAAESFSDRRKAASDRVREMRALSELEKIPDVQRRVKEALARGERVVVAAESANAVNFKAPGFAPQTGVLDQLAAWAKQEGIPFAKVYGPGNKRPAADRFLHNHVPLVLMTPRSGGTGIDLDDQTGGMPRRMIIMTPPWAGDVFEQMLGRVSRKNTKSPATIDVLRNPDSAADAHGWAVLQKKIAALEAVNNGLDPTQSKLDAVIAEEALAAKQYQDARAAIPLAETDELPQAPSGWDVAETSTEFVDVAAADQAAIKALDQHGPGVLSRGLLDVAEHLPPQSAALARYLARIVPDIPLLSKQQAIIRRLVSSNSNLGAFQFDLRTHEPLMIYISLNGPKPARTLLHEAVHAVTHAEYEAQSRKGTPLARALDQLFAQVQPLLHDSPELGVEYASRDMHEFLAEAFSNPAVQKLLSNVTITPELGRALAGKPARMTAWEGFKRWISRLLGLTDPEAYSALDGVLSGGGRLMEATGERNMAAAQFEAMNGGRTGELYRQGTGELALATTQATTGILEDTAARPNGIAARIMAAARGVSQGLKASAYGASSLDNIKEWAEAKHSALADGLGLYQGLVDKRSERISRLMDEEKLTSYQGKRITAKTLADTWMDLARTDRESAKAFDRLLTASTEQQIHLDRPLTDIKKDPSVPSARTRMWQRFRPEYDALPQPWKDLYPAVREYYQNTQQMLRDSLLNRLKQDIERAGTDLSNVDFRDLKQVKDSDLLTDTQKRNIRTIHAVYSPISFYAPLRRRGEYVVRADLDINGIFTAAEAERFKASFPDRRLVMENMPDGRVRLRIRATAPPDPTDPEVHGSGQGGQGEPLMLYERYESRHDAERRIRFLQEQAAKFAQRKDVTLDLRVRNIDRVKQDPGQLEPDPILSRGSQRELMTRIDNMGLSEGARLQMRRIINEATAGMMPDTYASKSRIRRRFVAGASQDQLRALGEHLTSFSHNLAHMEHDRVIEDQLDRMNEELNDATRYAVGTERENARLAMREINRRESVQLSRGQVSPWVNAVTGTTYFYMLASASYSMIQFMQPFMVGLPLLGARFGGFASTSQMGRAIRMFSPQTIAAGAVRTVQLASGRNVANVFDFKSILDDALASQPDGDRLKKGLHYARDIGLLDLSFSREIQEARSLPSTHRGERNIPQQLSSYGQWAVDISRMLPHAVEVSNRVVVFTAAYRMEYQRTGNHDKATAVAVDMVRKSQIDYSRANKPRFLQSTSYGGALRIPLMFKQYALHMYSLFAINAMKAVRGDRAERAQAAGTLIGLLATHALAAGAAGIMLEPIKIAIFAIAHTLGGDDDEPFDVDKWMHRGLRELFGETLGEAAYGGLPRLLGADISGRVGLQNLMMYNTLDDLDRGRSFYEIVGALLTGPAGSLAFKAIPDAFKAFAVGDVTKGVGLLMPKFAKDAVKSYGLGTEGILDSRGNRIDQTLDIGPGVLAAQALGFRPTQVANLYEARDAVIGKREFLDNRRQQLMERYWRSKGDADERRSVMAEIMEFNAANPQARISGDQLQRSMRERRRREQLTREGVYLSRRDRYLREEADYLRE